MQLKTAIRQSFLFKPVAAWRDSKAERAWIESGKIGPPPSVVKRRIIDEYRTRFNLDTLVETGTHLGDTVEFFRSKCARIFSIELSDTYARDAQERFRAYRHIEILHGDSGILLSEILKRLERPALFWLDGHYSGGLTAKADLDTPILRELESIFAHRIGNHVVLIDDARLFTGTDDYPTLEALRGMVQARKPEYSFAVEKDIIRCVSPG